VEKYLFEGHPTNRTILHFDAASIARDGPIKYIRRPAYLTWCSATFRVPASSPIYVATDPIWGLVPVI
jgi:hypothetical protein